VKLNYRIPDLVQLVQGSTKAPNLDGQVNRVSIDSRQISNAEGLAFFALSGKREGYNYVHDAYAKGCRIFVLPDSAPEPEFSSISSIVIRVPNVLQALQALAAHHRNQYHGKIIAITGSAGKTMVKEWLYFLLKNKTSVFRSPKSYNSQIGVALSLLELNNHYELAIIEAGVSQQGEMSHLQRMIRPDFGILTHMGSAHNEGFSSLEENLHERAILFSDCQWVVSRFNELNALNNTRRDAETTFTQKSVLTTNIVINGFGEFIAPFSDQIRLENLCTALAAVKQLGYTQDGLHELIANLPNVAMRMEISPGKNDTVLMNDAYNLDMDGLEQALIQQKQLAGDRKRVVVLAFKDTSESIREHAEHLIQQYKVDTYHSIEEANVLDAHQAGHWMNILLEYPGACLLFKGTHNSGLDVLVNKLKVKHHDTFLEINKAALRNNLKVFRSKLRAGTKLMVMVKASSYGSGSRGMAEFLEQEGVDYLGVAYVDEGVELREAGVSLPIFVMNPRDTAFDEIIANQLEPAIFSLEQLDGFVRQLIAHNLRNYPIHIKLETGMNRLGFREKEIPALLDFLQAQPEVLVKSIYSHLAESDSHDRSYTTQQIARFSSYDEQIANRLGYTYMRHICNTSGILGYPEAHFDMVRLGIGLYGLAEDSQLQNALQLFTHISKVNILQPGETLGYNREHVAKTEERIAVLPIGYADGLHRLHGNGKSSVLIDGKLCKLVGNICMDMCFVDVTDQPLTQVGAQVELFGNNHPIAYWAKQANTIPYEILTSISTRVNRIWVDE
jgi:Alr-MurF fusion protein